MTLHNAQERQQRGLRQQEKLLGQAPKAATTLFESSWSDYIFAEVWTRPGLDLRARYLIAASSAAANGASAEQLDGYMRGALAQEQLSLVELREAALHLAIYGGWSKGAALDEAITRVAAELGLPAEEFKPLRDGNWNPQQRLAEGAAEFNNVMTFGGPPPVSPYFEGGILNFVFGEAWCRPGLDQRARRWVTLVGVADSSADVPIRTHVYGAMASGNASYEEMNEFVLQYAIHSGWPRASFVQGVVMDMAKKIKAGLFWDGTALEKENESSK
ncbi:carboxymuconolactone decarboxylase family protein [Halioxenophilus sp. WMMB6]|uniref:carboxymuconolactone decarboxylase family protein n=1 Tax=Halioxenophilus sp. WMMB6 TaxID=3073815 RepID=UPI00295F04F6|nr:carboxymuconolactone decarboxylase family protein [Halioxenophilus sp. WMMB6]